MTDTEYLLFFYFEVAKEFLLGYNLCYILSETIQEGGKAHAG